MFILVDMDRGDQDLYTGTKLGIIRPNYRKSMGVATTPSVRYVTKKKKKMLKSTSKMISHLSF